MIKGKGREKFYTSKEACARLQISEKTLYRWISRGLIKPLRQGGKTKAGRLLFSERELDKLFKG